MSKQNITQGPEGLEISPDRIFVRAPGNALLILAEDGCELRDSPVYLEICRLCTSPHPVAEVREALQDRYRKEVIDRAIEDLLLNRTLTTTRYGGGQREAAFWSSLGAVPEPATVELTIHGGVPEGVLRDALGSYGLQMGTPAERGIVAVDDYLSPRLAGCSELPYPWLLTKPVGSVVWMGPIFQPGGSPCWTCLSLWMRPHRWLQASCFGWHDPSLLAEPSLAATRATLAAGAGMIATAAAIWCSTGRHQGLEDRIVTIDMRTLQSRTHKLRTHPECPFCAGTTGARVRELSDLVSPITGIVRSLEVTEIAAGGLFHATAQFIHALPTRAVGGLPEPRRAIGKGRTPAESETGALGEAVERYSIVYRGSESVHRASISGVDPLPLDRLFQFSDKQYEGRERWNAANEDIQRIPEPYGIETALHWVNVQSVASGLTRQAPAAYCYLNYQCESEPHIYHADTNGCAAGQTMDSAILAGMLELIERDAMAIWWYNRLRRPAVDLESFRHDGVNAIRDAMRQMGREPYLLDLTNDIQVPSYVAILPNRDGTDPCFGAAAHFSAGAAAFKALSEAVQVWFWARNLGGSVALRTFLDETRVEGESYLAPVGMSGAPPEVTLTAREAIRSVSNRLLAAGLEPYFLDCTRPEIGVPVVRVMAPGLRHFWARFGAGRLYEVPVAMGWRERRSLEEELNPVPCMI